MKIWIQSGNNKLSANIFRPVSSLNKLAVLLPGNLDSKDYPHMTMLARDLAKNGYTAISFDPTGTWESEGVISQYSVTQYLADLDLVIKDAISRNGKDFDQIVLLGHSLGGMISMLYTADHREISVVVGIMPSHDFLKIKYITDRLEKWQTQGYNISRRDLPGNVTQYREYKVPYSFIEDRSKYDLLEAVKKYDKQLILVAGENDQMTSPGYVKEIYDVANEPKQFLLVKGIGHDYRKKTEDIEKVNKLIIEKII